jgi:hypothetical protein
MMRHTGARDAAFLKEAYSHEGPSEEHVRTRLQNGDFEMPKPRPFKFPRSLSSGRMITTHKSEDRRKLSNTRHDAPDPQDLSNSMFSSFDFKRGPSTASSRTIGSYFQQPGHPTYMPTWIQNRYGGAAMAGLQMKEFERQERGLSGHAPSAPARFTVKAAAAFPALCRDDPALFQMLEPMEIIEKRREHLQRQLNAVDTALKQWQ